MKKYLATFYSSDLKRSAKRFYEQAKSMNAYDSINIFSEKDLDEDYRNYVDSLLKNGKKRIWLLGLATYFHKLVLKKMNDGVIFIIGVMLGVILILMDIKD